MRLKTFLFGLLSVILLSGRSTTTPDEGFNPGEQLPSIVVDGKDLSEALANEPNAVLVVWSVDDATSRVANVWANNNPTHREADTPVYSICVDGDDVVANFYSKIDGSNALINPIGIKGESKKHRGLNQLASRGSNKVYYTSYGVIEKVISSESLFREIQ